MDQVVADTQNHALTLMRRRGVCHLERTSHMLLVGRFARASGGNSFGGDEFTERVLRWERQDNKILLRSITFELTADSTLPVYNAVSQATYPPVVAVFKVEAYGPDSSAVVDVTSLYTTNVPEFTAARGSFDDKRSFIERVSSFPENVEVEATQTFTPENPPDVQRGLGPVAAQSILAHWSMNAIDSAAPKIFFIVRLHCPSAARE